MPVDRFSRQDARTLLSHVLEEGNVRYGPHFRKALEDENVTIQDADVVLKRGQIFNEAEQDIKTGEWTYRVEGETPDKKKLAIVICFKTENDVFLITVFGLRK
jgi:hypothetical protein